jgi:hypothetical protein
VKGRGGATRGQSEWDKVAAGIAHATIKQWGTGTKLDRRQMGARVESPKEGTRVS